MPLTPGLSPLVPGPLALQDGGRFEVVVEIGRFGSRLFISREVDRDAAEVSAFAQRGHVEIEHGVCFGPRGPIHAPGRDNLTDNFHVKAGELGFFVNLRFVGVALPDLFFFELDSLNESTELRSCDGGGDSSHQPLVLTERYAMWLRVRLLLHARRECDTDVTACPRRERGNDGGLSENEAFYGAGHGAGYLRVRLGRRGVSWGRKYQTDILSTAPAAARDERTRG